MNDVERLLSVLRRPDPEPEPARVKIKPLGLCEWTRIGNVYSPAGMSIVCTKCGDLTREHNILLHFITAANVRARLHLMRMHG